MATDIKRDYETSQDLTINLASLANGSSRQSTLITNSGKEPSALIFCKIKSGAVAPTGGQTYGVYLIRGNGSIRDDNAGAVDAAITIENAQLIGTIVVTADANKTFYKTFDTASLGPLGAEWGIAIKNSSGQALHATAGDHVISFVYHHDQIQ